MKVQNNQDKNVINAAVNAELMPNNLLHFICVCVRMYVYVR